MGNDTLRVDGDDRALDDIEASHADEWCGDDVLVRALVAEVRRLRAVAEAAKTARAHLRVGDGIGAESILDTALAALTTEEAT